MTNYTQNRGSRKTRTDSFVRRVKQERKENSSFGKILVSMIIILVAIVSCIFILGGSEDNYSVYGFSVK